MLEVQDNIGGGWDEGEGASAIAEDVAATFRFHVAAPSVSAVAVVPAAVRSNVWVLNFAPPASKDRPRTSSRLPIIEPVIEALTTPSKPFESANKAIINSAALPNVAFNKPPTP